MAKNKQVTENGQRVTGWTQQQIIEFIAVWNSSDSIETVVQRTRRSIQSCYTKCKQCKKQGIVMKTMKRGTGINWNDIKKQVPQFVDHHNEPSAT